MSVTRRWCFVPCAFTSARSSACRSVGHVEAEPFERDPDRVDAALLAEHDPSLRADELGGVRLDRRRVVELRRDRARLAGEERLAGHGLPGRQRRRRHARRRGARARAPASGRAASGCRRAPRARARPRRGRRSRRARPCRSRCPAPTSRPPARPRSPPRCRARSRRGRASAPGRRAGRARGRRAAPPPRASRCRACRRRRSPRRPPRPRRRTRGRRTRGRRARSRRRRTRRGCRSRSRTRRRCRIRSSIVSRETPSASSLPSEIGLSITDARTPSSTSASTSAWHGAREAPHLGAEPGAGDHLDRAEVVVGDAREARLDPVDARRVERLGDLELLLGREDDADRLLAVAQRRVVEADRDVRLRVERLPVDVAGPDLLRSITRPPSRCRRGTRRASPAPSSVISQLSSRRRPPPPSQ